MIIGKINIRRTLILLSVLLIGVFIGHKLTLSTSGKTLSNLTPTLDKAIDKTTIENTIENKINIGKVKKSDSIIIRLDPLNNQKPLNIISKDSDCDELIKALSKGEKKRLKKRGIIE